MTSPTLPQIVEDRDMQWQPIATAPKDRKAFLVWVPENKCIYCVTRGDGYWLVFGGGWRDHVQRPTHWMPLPAPPEEPRTHLLSLGEGV